MAAPMDDVVDLIDSDDYYAWLGLNKNASREEINNAFRKLSRMYHPDKHVMKPDMKEKSETLFTKIKKAHGVLIDEHQRAIYDTMGVKGLETEGWEVVQRTKSPQEIADEYERLSREREERKLQQRTNPKGTVTVSVDATDIFDPYEALDALDYRSSFPSLEIRQMNISQSVECPLTGRDTAVLSGNLSAHNGNGSGTVTGTFRRVLSHKGWAEIDLSAGRNGGCTIRGFRTLWNRGFGTLSGTCQLTPNGLRPGISAMVATQLDKHFQGRVTWNAGMQSSMSTMILFDSENYHIATSLTFGISNVSAAINCTRKLVEYDAKLKGNLRLSTYGLVFECGYEKKITQFSTIAASILVGLPVGVTLKIKLNRGNQNYLFPVHLSDSVQPNAIFYGVALPLLTYVAIKILIVKPFLKDQEQKDLEIKKEANATRLAEKKRQAEAAIELMMVAVERSIEVEERKNGLIIRKALFGKLQGDDVREEEFIYVTRSLQAFVQDSKLLVPENTSLCELPGFYDPCVGEKKQLSISYEFRKRLHRCIFEENDKILIPRREDMCETLDDSNQPSSSHAQH